MLKAQCILPKANVSSGFAGAVTDPLIFQCDSSPREQEDSGSILQQEGWHWGRVCC